MSVLCASHDGPWPPASLNVETSLRVWFLRMPAVAPELCGTDSHDLTWRSARSFAARAQLPKLSAARAEPAVVHACQSPLTERAWPSIDPAVVHATRHRRAPAAAWRDGHERATCRARGSRRASLVHPGDERATPRRAAVIHVSLVHAHGVYGGVSNASRPPRAIRHTPPARRRSDPRQRRVLRRCCRAPSCAGPSPRRTWPRRRRARARRRAASARTSRPP